MGAVQQRAAGPRPLNCLPDTGTVVSHARTLQRHLDLAAAVAWLALAWLFALVPVLDGTLLAGGVALGALLLLPGYALVAALFPAHDGDIEMTDDSDAIALPVAAVTVDGERAMVVGVPPDAPERLSTDPGSRTDVRLPRPPPRAGAAGPWLVLSNRTR